MREYDLIADWYAASRTGVKGQARAFAPMLARVEAGRPHGYRDLLRSHGLVLEDTHEDRGGNIYYLARKIE